MRALSLYNLLFVMFWSFTYTLSNAQLFSISSKLASVPKDPINKKVSVIRPSTSNPILPSNSSTSCDANEESLCLTTFDTVVSPLLHGPQHPMDCSSSKFMVVYWFDMGFGAAIMSAVAAFRVAQHQNRVFLIHAEWGSGFFASVANSSLCPNQNAPDAWECYFQPISSCTMEDAIKRAGVKTPAELKLKRNLAYWSFGFKLAANAHDKLFNAPVVFVDMYLPWMSKQSRTVRERMRPWGKIMSNKNDDLFLGTAMRYIIRLNAATLEQFRPAIQKEVSKLTKNAVFKTISLPIRGADKCGTPVLADGTLGKSRFESACLTFKTYMNAVESIREFGVGINTVIITSEDARYIKAAKSHQETLIASGGSLKLVFNELDEQQGDSRWVALSKTSHSHSRIIFSMWSTLELQMHAIYYIMNCNSHWHQFIRAIRVGGCGYSQPIFFCLDQQHPKSPYFMCTQENVSGKSALASCRGRSARDI